MFKLLDRYITRELLGPFGVALLTFVVLITGHILFTVVQVIVEHGVPLPNIAKFLALQVPRAAVLALPISTLLACALGLNRLGAEQELTALRAGGVSLARVMRPVLLLGTAAVVASFAVSELVVPWANHEGTRMLHEIVLSHRALVFRPGKFTEASPQIHFYVEQVDRAKNLLTGVYFFFNQPDDFPIMVRAESADFGEQELRARGATFYHLPQDGQLTWGGGSSAQVNLAGLLAEPPAQFSTVETMRFAELIQEWHSREQQSPGHGRQYAVEIHWRMALACSCLVFALLAGAISGQFTSGQQLLGVLMTLLVVFVYYVLMLWLRMLGDSGILPALVSGWSLNTIILVVSLVAIRRQS